MGKPFKKELSRLPETLAWAESESIERLRTFISEDVNIPLYIVGSGGSLSACYYAASLYQRLGGVGKAVTPLELFYLRHSLRRTKVLFISASGANSDILFGFKLAITFEPKEVLCISMRRGSPLEELALEYEMSHFLSFEIPTGKDGFLATNTLVAYFAILAKSFGENLKNLHREWHLETNLKQVDDFVSVLSPEHTLTVLYGGWGQAIGYDIESKFTEAALGNILLSDFRNFGHGRHHWFAKRAKMSAVIALITPEEETLAQKTLALLPPDIPQLVIDSKAISALASIELLLKSFVLVSAMGDLQGIDPGKPGVPDFGSKLYHLRYSDFFKNSIKKRQDQKNLAITRKTNVSDIDMLPSNEIDIWQSALKKFIGDIESHSYSSIIFDYDGTLCKKEEKSEGISEYVASELVRILKSGVIIGIASGRGKSLRIDLQKKIPRNFWEQVVVGYYNGSEVGFLSDDSVPQVDQTPNPILIDINKEITENRIYQKYINVSLRKNQLSIEIKDAWQLQIRDYLLQLSIKYPNVVYVESSHSIDIILRETASKLNVRVFCQQIKGGSSLCIGDKGQWPGNDYELLSTPFSLSVDEVSAEPNTCWNIAPNGSKGVSATLYYLSKIQVSNNLARISI